MGYAPQSVVVAIAKNNRMLRDVFLAFMRVHLLHHAAAGRIYGLEMIEELRRHGYDMGPGTLYPMLHGMEADGYLKSEQEVAGGKVRLAVTWKSLVPKRKPGYATRGHLWVGQNEAVIAEIAAFLK